MYQRAMGVIFEMILAMQTFQRGGPEGSLGADAQNDCDLAVDGVSELDGIARGYRRRDRSGRSGTIRHKRVSCSPAAWPHWRSASPWPAPARRPPQFEQVAEQFASALANYDAVGRGDVL